MNLPVHCLSWFDAGRQIDLNVLSSSSFVVVGGMGHGNTSFICATAVGHDACALAGSTVRTCVRVAHADVVEKMNI